MTTLVKNRVEVMHGVNLNQLARRDPAHYGNLDLAALERQIESWALEIGLSVRFFQTNHEGDFVEHLHEVMDLADGIILNPGAWTHYSWAIHDALELVKLPAIEVHLSSVTEREEWRQRSVVRDLCAATVSGKGVDGYREALTLLKKELSDEHTR